MWVLGGELRPRGRNPEVFWEQHGQRVCSGGRSCCGKAHACPVSRQTPFLLSVIARGHELPRSVFSPPSSQTGRFSWPHGRTFPMRTKPSSRSETVPSMRVGLLSTPHPSTLPLTYTQSLSRH